MIPDGGKVHVWLGWWVFLREGFFDLMDASFC